MPYTIQFSDPTKANSIVIPDMPPGINTIDTSLSLIGKGYPNYGLKISENFVHLLENFAGPLPPVNPIEGQLWYDTSDTHHKVLRVMDGTADAIRWPSVTGIYQQYDDPKTYSYVSLQVGDIWVDAENNQLKIYNNQGEWTLVGPVVSSGGGKTGSEIAVITDIYGNQHSVIKNWANDKVIAIVSYDAEFTPNPVIDNFTTIKPGITLRNKDVFSETLVSYYRLNGTANAALNLEINDKIYPASDFLRKADLTSTITGRLILQHNDGLTIYRSNESDVGMQLFLNDNHDIWLSNNVPNRYIKLQTRTEMSVTPQDTLVVSNNFVGVNTGTNMGYLLDVYGTARVANTLTVSNIVVENDISLSDPAKNAFLGQVVTTGTMVLFAGTNAMIPAGWILCDGGYYNTATHTGLYQVLGIAQVPDMGASTTDRNGAPISYIIKT